MANKTSSFTDYNPPSADAAWLNIQQTEMNNLITGSGLTVDNTRLVNTQQQQSVSRFAANNFYIDSGAADAYVLTLAASFTNPVSATIGYFVGMTIRFRAGNAGTGGAATVNVNGAGIKSLKEANGSTNPSSIPTTEDTEWRYDGTVFRKVNSVVAATESVAGIGEIATASEAKAFTDDLRFITPLKLSNAIGQIAIFQDQKSSGTAGGSNGSSVGAGATIARTLNTTVINNISGASLSSNQITLPAGTYIATSQSACYAANGSKSFLRNITDSIDTILGNSFFTNTANGYGFSSFSGQFTISGTKVFELRQYNRSPDGGGSGLGNAVNNGQVEIYSTITITKIN